MIFFQLRMLMCYFFFFRKLNSTFIVRAGEWDLKTEKEIYPHQDRRVLKIVTHEKFYSAALFNDVALLFTEEPFILQKHVQLICLPEAKDKYDHESCFSSGWGKIVNHNNYTIVRKTEMGTSSTSIISVTYMKIIVIMN